MALLKAATPVQPVDTSVAEPTIAAVAVDPNLTQALTPEELVAARAAIAEQPPVVAEVIPQDTATAAWVEPTTAAVEQPVTTVAVANIQPSSVTVYDPPTSSNPGAALTVSDFAEAGFEGLVESSRNFPIISLKTDGVFKDINDNVYPCPLQGYPLGSTSNWLYAAKFKDPIKRAEERTEVIFSADRMQTENGEMVADWCEKMKSQFNAVIDEREYLHVLLQIHAPGQEYDGDIRIFSISPESRKAFTGVCRVLGFKQKWQPGDIRRMSEHLLTISIANGGKQIQGKKGSFFLTAFKFD